MQRVPSHLPSCRTTSFQGNFQQLLDAVYQLILSSDLASAEDSEGLGGLRAVVHTQSWPHLVTILCTPVEARRPLLQGSETEPRW